MAHLLDVEDESILSNIFKDSFPESWQENPEFVQYLAELSSYGIDKLSHEPDRLAEERAQILEQTQDLAFHNYKTFIQTAECSRDIFQDFQIIEQHVGSMLEKLPDLSKDCKIFLKEAHDINISRRMNNMTLERYTQLLEILEMPQLMDTCVRNNYYDEALELAAHVKRLEKKHSSIAVIKNIVEEVKVATQLMLTQLISQLRSNVQLPACLRIIGYLRRMDAFTEAELRIKFLQARDSWFQSVLEGIPTDDAYHHITKTIELSRVHLFDIFTQYRAIFSDEDPVLALTKTDSDTSTNEAAIFHGWVIQRVSQFLTTLETDLSTGVGTRLDSVLGQCMYFGLSFSRVGADFRGLLVPIFQRAVLSDLIVSIRQADQHLEEAMQSYTLIGTSGLMTNTPLNVVSQGSNQLQPPIVLLQYQPLGVYMNNILQALNDLRLCAPVSLVCDVMNQIQQSMCRAAYCIQAYHRAEEPTFNDQEKEKFVLFVRAFCEHLVPHVKSCLEQLYPVSQLSSTFGISAIEICKIKTFGTIDAQTVIEPLQHLLPTIPDESDIQPTDQPETKETDDVNDLDSNLLETNNDNDNAPKTEKSETVDKSDDETSDNELSENLDNVDTSEPDETLDKPTGSLQDEEIID